MLLINKTNIDTVSSFILEYSLMLDEVAPETTIRFIAGDPSVASRVFVPKTLSLAPITVRGEDILYDEQTCLRIGFSNEEIHALLLQAIGRIVLGHSNIISNDQQAYDFESDDFVCKFCDEAFLVSALNRYMLNCDSNSNEERLRINNRVARINIRRWHIPVPQQDYMVVIHCSTYNHELYIEDALKGFVMQKTDFPFCAIVIDDASTDHTADIIRRYEKLYPEIIKGIYLPYNHMQTGLSRDPYFMPWHKRTKYLAMCEGDDYWVDPNKLSLQVRFLESNSGYGLVRTNVDRLYVKDNHMERAFFDNFKIRDTAIDYILNAWWAAPCTWLYNRSIVDNDELDDIRHAGGFGGDLAMLLLISERSKIKYFNTVTAVYRVIDNSASHFVNKKKRYCFLKKTIITRRWFAKKQPWTVRARLELKIFFLRFLSILGIVRESMRKLLGIE